MACAVDLKLCSFVHLWLYVTVGICQMRESNKRIDRCQTLCRLLDVMTMVSNRMT
jgi:hypothetical protein